MNRTRNGRYNFQLPWWEKNRLAGKRTCPQCGQPNRTLFKPGDKAAWCKRCLKIADRLYGQPDAREVDVTANFENLENLKLYTGQPPQHGITMPIPMTNITLNTTSDRPNDAVGNTGP